MPVGQNYLTRLLAQADACIDLFSVEKIDFITRMSRNVLPAGFWGDGHALNSVNHPELCNSRAYLTFDDGPSPHTTPYLLEMLEEQGIQATFFLIGKEAERYPDLVKAIADAGHTIGNHSYSHLFLPGLSTKMIEREIERTNKEITEIIGEQPKIFRPPFGVMDGRAASALTERAMHPVYWSQAPEDWALPGAQRVVRRVLMKLAPGALIVLHEGKFLKQQTLLAAKEIIYRCKSSNLSLAKVELRA